MEWEIEYFDRKLENEILELQPRLLAKYLRLADLMIEFGPDLGLPHTKAMGKSLFELRIRGAEGIARIFFCVRAKKIIMLHLFIKKTEKTPKKELKIALSRLMEV